MGPVPGSGTSGPPTSEPDSDRQMRAELDRRITEFACYSDSTFGPLNKRDLILTVILFIVVPLLVVWGTR
jgi:hypothetical protein